MIRERSCGAVVFTRIKGQLCYVIIRQREGAHGFPKGHMERNETEEETAIREIREEVGLRPRLIPGFRTQSNYPLPRKRGSMKQVTYFLAEYHDQPLVIQEKELWGAELLPYQEAYDRLEFDDSKRILREAHAFLTAQGMA